MSCCKWYSACSVTEPNHGLRPTAARWIMRPPRLKPRVIRLKTRDSVTTIGAGMAHYIDGFVLPIPRDRLNEYKRVVEAVAGIWKEHGALDYLEYVGDDLTLEGTRSFTDLAAATEDETIVFGWVVFDSREARDLANEKVAADPRMADLIDPLIDPSNPVFDAKRMAYGG